MDRGSSGLSAIAPIGVAFEDGTALADDAADAVVTTGDLRALPALPGVASGTQRRVRENLAWAFCDTAVAVPLALVGLHNPLFAAVAMAASSLLVVANSTHRPAGDRHRDDARRT